MTEQPKQPDQVRKQVAAPEAKSKTYLDHGVQSLVAMDNPDDSQLGTEKAGRNQTRA